MLEQTTDVPYNRSTNVYMTCQSVLDGYAETPYNAVECAYITPVGHGVIDVDGISDALPVIHTLDELDMPLHEYIRAPTRVKPTRHQLI